LAVNYLLTDVLPLLKSDIKISADSFLALMLLLQDRKIGSRIAKDILLESIPLDTDIDMEGVLEERGLVGGMSVEALALLVQDVLTRFPDVVAEYRAGKVTALQFLLGQIMKESKGKADPVLAADKLKAELG
jgi:aspartyl-tRNA(Asn)/glutamyl-tRNA(Gln) amidotransferase subunit B